MACDSGCQALFIGVESYDHNSLVSMVVTSQEVWGGSRAEVGSSFGCCEVGRA